MGSSFLDCMLFGLACLSWSNQLIQIKFCLNRLFCSNQLVFNSDSWPLVDRLLPSHACSYAPRWILDLSSGSFPLDRFLSSWYPRSQLRL